MSDLARKVGAHFGDMPVRELRLEAEIARRQGQRLFDTARVLDALADAREGQAEDA